LAISDTGVGIGQGEVAKLFTEDIHNHTRGTEGEKGTGFGLGICKKIIDAHGFTISVASALHEGTTFTITCASIEDI